MRLEKTKNTIRNFMWGTINKVATLLLPFLIRTIIIHVLGKEYLGLNNLFSSILDVLNLAELGIGSAMVYAMYEPIAQGNIKRACELLNLYKRLYTYIGYIILSIGILITPFLQSLIHGTLENINIYVLYVIYLGDTVLSYLLYAYKTSILAAYQRTDIISKVSTVIQLLLNILQIVVLLAFRNYYLYILLKPLFTIGNNMLIKAVTSKLYPDLVAEGEVPNSVKMKIYTNVGALFGHKIGSTIISSADSLVISAFLGLGILAIYSNYYYVVYFLISVTGVLFNGMLAGIGNSLVVESAEYNYTLFKNINFFTNWLVSWCSICLLCLIQPFMKLWMGSAMLLPYSSVLWIVIYYYTWQFRTTGLFFKDAAGMWKDDFLKPYVGAIVNVVANIILVKTIGINGVFMSTVFCMVGIYYPWETCVLFKKLFKRRCKGYLKRNLKFAAITVLSALCTFGLCSMINCGEYTDLFIRGVICLIIPNLIWIVFFRKQSEFAFLIEKAKGLVIRRYDKR